MGLEFSFVFYDCTIYNVGLQSLGFMRDVGFGVYMSHSPNS